MPEVIRLRKELSAPLPLPVWPDGVTFATVAGTDPAALHAILHAAYANGFGSVPAPEIWWPAVTSDSEYDEDLFLVATDATNHPVGLCLCWTSGFIKDIAVTADMRGRGIGEALLNATFLACRQRGLDHVDLKVISASQAAIRLYRRSGMVEAPF